MKLDEQTVLRCPKLKQGILHLKGQQLININIIPQVMNAGDLKEIYIENNMLKQLGELSKYCWGIKKISASVNFLSLFSEIAQFSELIHLDVSTNRFTEMGDMSHMTNLKYLNIQHNNTSFIQKLPSNLEVLKAGWNNLSNLNFITSQKLTQLHLSNNQIKHISRLADKCNYLKVLDLSYNMISKEEYSVLEVLLKNQLKKINVLSFEGNQIATMKNFVLEVLRYTQPDRINSNLITPFLKSTFKNLFDKNNLDDFLSLVQTDYGVNIKKQYQKKSNQIRSLNYAKQNNFFDDFKQMNKDKIIRFLEQMNQNNNRKKDNQMINLYKQMKVMNKQQEERQRIIKQKKEDDRIRQKIKQKEIKQSNNRKQREKENEKPQSKKKIKQKQQSGKPEPSIQYMVSQESSQTIQKSEESQQQQNSSEVISEESESKEESQSQQQSQSESEYRNDSDESQQSNQKPNKYQKKKKQVRLQTKNNIKSSNSQKKSTKQKLPNKTMSNIKNKPKQPTQSQLSSSQNTDTADLKQGETNKLSDKKYYPTNSLSKRQSRIYRNHNKEPESELSLSKISSNIDTETRRQQALDEEDHTGIYDPRIWQHLHKHYEYY